MTEELINMIQEAFAETYNLGDLTRLYFDIRMECEKQLEYMSYMIAKDMHENGVFEQDGITIGVDGQC